MMELTLGDGGGERRLAVVHVADGADVHVGLKKEMDQGMNEGMNE
jgi:hypothetical protein